LAGLRAVTRILITVPSSIRAALAKVVTETRREASPWFDVKTSDGACDLWQNQKALNEILADAFNRACLMI